MATPGAAEVQRKKDEQLLDNSLDALIDRTNDLKNSIIGLLAKLDNEHATMQWPSLLDSMGLISGQLTGLRRTLGQEKFPQLRNYVALPLTLSQDVDANLERLTEGRLKVLSHESVPNYLRTKPEPEVEARVAQTHREAANLAPETLTKQKTSLNKMANAAVDKLQEGRETREAEIGKRVVSAATFSQEDTKTLLKSMLKPPQASQPAGFPGSPAARPAAKGSGQAGRTGGAVRANIKAHHPYPRR